MGPYLIHIKPLGVLQREKFRRYVTLEEVELYVAGIASHADTRPDPPAADPIARDPNDDYLVAFSCGSRSACRCRLSSFAPSPSASPRRVPRRLRSASLPSGRGACRGGSPSAPRLASGEL